MNKDRSPWNSLELSKLIVSISLPFAVALCGYWFQESLQENQKEITKSLQENQNKIQLSNSVIEERKEIYEDIRIPLNNIYCYIEEIGNYKQLTPETITNDRRRLHQVMHTQRAYWSPNTFAIYLQYMDDTAFETWQGINTDAVIRCSPGQKASLPSWKKQWSSKFKGPTHPEHKKTYDRLLDALAKDIGANVGS